MIYLFDILLAVAFAANFLVVARQFRKHDERIERQEVITDYLITDAFRKDKK